MREIDVQKFLQKIVWSISAVIVYLVVNITMGIMFGWLFFEGGPKPGNYIYYVWVLITSIGIGYLLYRMWRKLE